MARLAAGFAWRRARAAGGVINRASGSKRTVDGGRMIYSMMTITLIAVAVTWWKLDIDRFMSAD